ncbi:MAG: S49 family peptidase [Gammaproteobacteria bacterium]|nr:S49 family peptidase [Gammaproteobacteria bacterium]
MSEPKKETLELDRSLVEELLLYSNNELTRIRRNRIINYFVKGGLVVGVLMIAYFIGGTNISGAMGDKHKPHLAYVEIYGPIASGQLADTNRLIPSLHKAFKDPLSKAVALRINSPGGSPVQAGQMYKEINNLKEKYPDKPLYAVIEELGASAAYYIASAADKIYVDPASMVGSIGVISAGFGYSDVMEKVGVERRVLTSGTNKSLLDPYLPIDPKVVDYWKEMLNEIHGQFIAAVKEGRGDRLKADYPDLFSGLIWTGQKSIEIGLTDEVGSMASVSRATVDNLNIVNYTPSPDLLKQLVDSTHAMVSAAKYSMMTPQLY